MQLRTLTALASATLFGLTGCLAGSFVESATEAPVALSVDLAGLAVSGVSVEVTGPGIPEAILANLPISDGVATGSIAVLAGSDRAFLIRAFDPQGVETHRGQDTTDIAADQPQTLEIPLSPLVGDVEVGGRIGDYAVTVSLASPTLGAGASAQATVTVIDAYGNEVASPQVTWGSSNPAVASVSAGGLVEGLVPGETTIGASYQGFGGSAQVAVQ